MQESDASGQPRSALGKELAAYRRAAGLSQAQLARFTEYSRSTIANIETGRQHVPRTFWERADKALRTGGILASAHDEIEAAARRDLQAVARAVSTTRRSRTWQQHQASPPQLPEAEQAGRTTAQPRSAWRSFRVTDPEPPWSADGSPVAPRRFAAGQTR